MLRVLLFYILFSISLFAQTLHISNENIDSSFQINYLEDTTSSLTINEIQKQDFTKTTKNNFNLGYRKGSLWFKIIAENKSDTQDFILTVNEHFYEKANLYYENNGAMEKLSNSLFTPISQREVKSNKLAFTLKLPRNAPQTLYLELQGKYAYFGKIEILEKEYFYFQQSMGTNSFFTFVLGVIFVLMFFTLFLYTKTKEKIYLYYLGYSFFLFIYLSNITGLLVFIDLQKYMYNLHLSAAFMVGFLILLSREYLETKKYLPKFDKILIALSIPFFILGVLVLFSYQPWNKYINNFSGLVSVLLITVSAIVYFKGHKQSKYYTLAMVIYLVFVVLFTFMVTGVLEYSYLTRYGFVVGIIIEMLFFSYLLANRYHLSKQTVQNYLEKEIVKRTQELNSSLNEKRLLLKELHHRVKNNFHLLIGMLYLEQEKEKIDFQGILNRVKSMSLIHEYLYINKDLAHIEIKSYLEKLLNNIKQSYPKVGIIFECEAVPLSFDNALSLGIIINEVLTNSIKHSTKAEEDLQLYINLFKKSQGNTLYLFIKDNGCGFENEDSKGLGLKLIHQFCKKLPNSKCSFTFDNGVKFELYFTIKENLEKQ